MVTTVSAEGSAFGPRGSVSQNLVPKDYRTVMKCFNPKMIIEKLKMHSFPVTVPVLLVHLLYLSDLSMKAWIFAMALLMLGTSSVSACPEPSVKLVNGYRIPDIHPCKTQVNLAGRGIEELHFEEVNDELRIFNVSYNRIENIQTNLFHGMTSLQSVDVSHNNLIAVRKENFNGSVIERLYLSNNQIEVLSEGAFEGLGETLRFLTLAVNHLQSLPKGVFNNLRHITVLDISFNDLSVVDQDAFKGMDRILRLNLQGNQLTVVSGWLPPVRRQLDLSFNNITTTEGVPQDAAIDLNLTGNPLTCSQENEEFSKWCSQTENCHGPNVLEARCDSIDPNSDKNAKPHNSKSKGESHTTNDPNAGSEGRRPYASGVLVIVVSLLAGY